MTDKLDPHVFDRMTRRPDRMWGARKIATFLGVSEETVRNWAQEGDVPIFQPRPRSYYASRRELEEWLRQKPAA